MGTPADTSLGGAARGFPSTRWSLLLEAADPRSPVHARAMDEFCRIYWKPIYAYLRASRPFTNEEAKDMAQDFLLHLVEGGLIARFSRERGNFRTFLKGALKLFVLNHHRDTTTAKRGGDRKPMALDAEGLERVDRMIGASAVTPEEAFDRQWANALLDQAVTDLRESFLRSGREVVFQIFDRHDLNPPSERPPTYAELAQEFGVKETDVTNHLSTCRRMLREIVELSIRDFVDTDEEGRQELARLFGS